MEMTPSHLSSTLLKHVSLKFYLDDSAHLLQPLNQGVVRHFKAYFRRRLLQTALAHSSPPPDGAQDWGQQALKTVTELDAMFWIQVRLGGGGGERGAERGRGERGGREGEGGGGGREGGGGEGGREGEGREGGQRGGGSRGDFKLW